MNGGEPFFVDTNVLVYGFDEADPAKQQAARDWLDLLWSSGSGRLSWQVLSEFYYNAVGKIRAPVKIIRPAVLLYSRWLRAEFGFGTIERAWYWMDHAGVSYWDGLILASAESSGCGWLLSEDFQAGRKYGSIQVIDPFQTEPREFFRGQVQ